MQNVETIKKESILIQNVGAIKEVKLDEIKPLTIFVGATATGKSTIMKVILLMRYIYKMVNIRSYLKNAKIAKSPFRLHLKSLLYDGMEELITPKSVISYSVEVEGTVYTIEIKDKKLLAGTVNIKNKGLVFFKESLISETRNLIPTWVSRMSANKGAQLSFYFHETFKEFNEATEKIEHLPIDFLHLALHTQKSKAGKQHWVESQGAEQYRIKLEHASSGTQFVVPLLSILRYFAHEFSFKDAFQRSVLKYLYEQDLLSHFRPEIELTSMSKYVHVYIEEPELSLDPLAQRALLNAMVHQLFHDHEIDRTLHLMLATHSPYIVNQLNLLLGAHYAQEKGRTTNYPAIAPARIGVYHVDEGGITSLMAHDNLTQRRVVNTIGFATPMEDIYTEYQQLQQE